MWTSNWGEDITGAIRALPPTTGDHGWSDKTVTNTGMTSTKEVKHCPMSILAWSQGYLACLMWPAYRSLGNLACTSITGVVLITYTS